MMTLTPQPTRPFFSSAAKIMVPHPAVLSDDRFLMPAASHSTMMALIPAMARRAFAVGLVLWSLLTITIGAGPACAAEAPAGKVAAVAGQVTVAGADGSIRSLNKDNPVFSGDIISTGPNSRVRIVFSDDGVIFLRPSTRFAIKSYKHSGSVEKDEGQFSLVRGGFRSVTGAIGHANPNSYRVETPVATIGIRGTDHEGRFCAGDCADLVDLGVSAPPNGLYTGTNVGRTTIGGQQFGAGQYGFTGPGGVTKLLTVPPQILVKDPMLRNSLTDAGGSTKGGNHGGKGVGGAGFEVPAKPPTTQTIDCK
jgi:hypothetical protein